MDGYEYIFHAIQETNSGPGGGGGGASANPTVVSNFTTTGKYAAAVQNTLSFLEAALSSGMFSDCAGWLSSGPTSAVQAINLTGVSSYFARDFR
jgi:hypothetical protein